jgi:hypothetical protein
MKRFNATLKGTAPLLMHNERLADPTSKYSKGMKALTGKRKKTDEDHLDIKRAEWHGGLYTNEDETEVVVPVDWILAMALGGAKKSKDGPKVKSGVFEIAPYFPLQFAGKIKGKVSELFDAEHFVDYRGVGVNGKRVMRCRPRFPNWSLDIALDYDETVLDGRELLQFITVAGQLLGIGDYRPRFGRFTVSQ